MTRVVCPCRRASTIDDGGRPDVHPRFALVQEDLLKRFGARSKKLRDGMKPVLQQLCMETADVELVAAALELAKVCGAPLVLLLLFLLLPLLLLLLLLLMFMLDCVRVCAQDGGLPSVPVWDEVCAASCPCSMTCL